jgi:drug/metabolite transporter (DMT)-like permease
VVNATAISNSGNFIIPLLISRSIAVLITIPYLHLFKKPKENESKPQKINLLNLSLMVLLMGLTAGIFDGVGDVLFGFITLHKYLALGGAFGILQIAIIAIIGYFVYKDKLKWPELAGLVVSIVGAILLAFF